MAMLAGVTALLLAGPAGATPAKPSPRAGGAANAHAAKQAAHRSVPRARGTSAAHAHKATPPGRARHAPGPGTSHAPGRAKRTATAIHSTTAIRSAPTAARVAVAAHAPSRAHETASLPRPAAPTPRAAPAPGPLQKVIAGLTRLDRWSPLRGPLGWLFLGAAALALAMITAAFTTGRGAAWAVWPRRLGEAEEPVHTL